jgi:hypothetical protein
MKLLRLLFCDALLAFQIAPAKAWTSGISHLIIENNQHTYWSTP